MTCPGRQLQPRRGSDAIPATEVLPGQPHVPQVGALPEQGAGPVRLGKRVVLSSSRASQRRASSTASCIRLMRKLVHGDHGHPRGVDPVHRDRRHVVRLHHLRQRRGHRQGDAFRNPIEHAPAAASWKPVAEPAHGVGRRHRDPAPDPYARSGAGRSCCPAHARPFDGGRTDAEGGSEPLHGLLASRPKRTWKRYPAAATRPSPLAAPCRPGRPRDGETRVAPLPPPAARRAPRLGRLPVHLHLDAADHRPLAQDPHARQVQRHRDFPSFHPPPRRWVSCTDSVPGAGGEILGPKTG
jgi:hypothetical protein